MEHLPKEQVPEITLFDQQGQFSATRSTAPAVGTAVTGTTRTATTFNVIGRLGERSGPVDTVALRDGHRLAGSPAVSAGEGLLDLSFPHAIETTSTRF